MAREVARDVAREVAETGQRGGQRGGQLLSPISGPYGELGGIHTFSHQTHLAGIDRPGEVIGNWPGRQLQVTMN